MFSFFQLNQGLYDDWLLDSSENQSGVKTSPLRLAINSGSIDLVKALVKRFFIGDIVSLRYENIDEKINTEEILRIIEEGIQGGGYGFSRFFEAMNKEDLNCDDQK